MAGAGAAGTPAGRTAALLREQGFNANDLRANEFVAASLAEARFTVRECLVAGYLVAELLLLYDRDEIARAAVRLPGGTLLTAAIADLRTAGYSLTQLHAAGAAAAALKGPPDVDRKTLRAAGYSLREIYAAGFRLEGFKWVGYTLKEHVQAGATVAELRAAGYEFDAYDLLAAGGFGSLELLLAFHPIEVFVAAFSVYWSYVVAAGLAIYWPFVTWPMILYACVCACLEVHCIWRHRLTKTWWMRGA